MTDSSYLDALFRIAVAPGRDPSEPQLAGWMAGRGWLPSQAAAVARARLEEAAEDPASSDAVRAYARDRLAALERGDAA
jgi:hypothetical protein